MIWVISNRKTHLRLLTERAALGQASLTTGGLRENLSARAADDDGLGVGEDGGDGEATRALDVHEERVGVLHKSLELVRASLLLGGGVQKVDGESLAVIQMDRKRNRKSQYFRLGDRQRVTHRLAAQSSKRRIPTRVADR